MFIKDYIKHTLLLLFMLLLSSFLLFILFYNLDIFQTIIFAVIFILFFRDFYQLIIGSIFNLIFFIFFPKILNIKKQEDGRYMIIKEIKKINIFKYLNILIDKIYNIFIKLFFLMNNSLHLNKHNYKYLEKDLNFIIIKRDLQKDEANKQLLKYQRLEKLKSVI
jgi:hypothetical protein